MARALRVVVHISELRYRVVRSPTEAMSPSLSPQCKRTLKAAQQSFLSLLPINYNKKSLLNLDVLQNTVIFVNKWNEICRFTTVICKASHVELYLIVSLSRYRNLRTSSGHY